jgi:hypothetical protein
VLLLLLGSPQPILTNLKQHWQPLQIFNQKFWPCKKPPLAGNFVLHRNVSLRQLNRPYVIECQSVGCAGPGQRAARCGKSLLVIPNEAPPSQKLAILAVRSGAHALETLIKAPSMAPAVTPDRRVDAAVPGPRRVAVISGPTGGHRCPRYGALLKRRSRVHSSRSWFGSSNGTPGPGVAREPQFKRSWFGSSNGTPGPGVAREPQFKSHFKGEARQRRGAPSNF